MVEIKTRNNSYLPGLEPWPANLNERKIKILKSSWAGVFRDHLLETLPIHAVSLHFSKTMGRPTKELVTVVGACVFQQVFDLSDVETRDQLAFNEQWHYALDSFNPKDHVVSLKTLWTMRNILVNDKLAKETFSKSADKLADVYHVDTRLQRLDSVHIQSNMAQLGRVRLLSRTITTFLKNLKRHHKDLYFDSSLQELRVRYEKEEDDTYFGNVKPSGSRKRLAEIAVDLHTLLNNFCKHDDVASMYSYKFLERVFSEQCRIEEDKIIVKESSEISSDSLQNPSDADATYDGHKGPGYQVQIMETYTPKTKGYPEANQEKPDKASLELVTYVEVEPAHNHDSCALEPALEDVSERDLLPDELAADTSYGSETNKQKAQEYGVDLVAPLPGRKPQKDLSVFIVDQQTEQIRECPYGHKPEKIKHNKKGSITAIWSKSFCGECSNLDNCPVRSGKSGYLLNYTREEIHTMLRRQYEQSKEFKEKYRYRSGIEATNSRYIHMTGARRLNYRGLPKISYAARLKALGINLFRAARYQLQHGIRVPENRKLALNVG
jgi:hypothetical protein